jgi:hypothetical protein
MAQWSGGRSRTRAAALAFAALALALSAAAAGLLAGCGDQAAGPAGPTQPPSSRLLPPPPGSPPAVVISDRDGPSWRGELGDAVQVDWYDQTTGTTVSERVAVLRVKRVPAAADAGPYDWRYGIKVRLTSLDERSARRPVAWQFLQLRDGRDSEDGVSGLGEAGGPDPSRAGQASVGWLYQWAEEGFTPTRVMLSVGPWRATWSLD